MVFFRYFSTGFPKVPYGTECTRTETYWQFLHTLQGISAPRHTALCIQTVGLTAASPQPYFPNKSLPFFIQPHDSLPGTCTIFKLFSFVTRLRTVYKVWSIRSENTVSSTNSEVGEKTIFASLHYPKCWTKLRFLSNQTLLVFSAKPFLLNSISHYFNCQDTYTSLLLLLTETSSQHTLFRCLHLEATSQFLPCRWYVGQGKPATQRAVTCSSSSCKPEKLLSSLPN